MNTLLFDTETTDLIKNSLVGLNKQPKIIEIYGHIIDDDYNVISEFNYLINPNERLSAKTIEITKIEDSMLIGKPLFRNISDQFQDFVSNADLIVAHNLKYDTSVINFEYARLNKKIKWPNNFLCTVESTEHLFGYRLSLSDLYEYLFNEKFKDAHRAKNDVIALTKCFIELKKRGEI